MQSPLLRFGLPAVFVAAGLAGWLHLRAHPVQHVRSSAADADANWFLRSDCDGEPRYSPPPGSDTGIELLPGTTFQMLEEDYELQRYGALSFLLQPCAPDTCIELTIRETPQASATLEVRPGTPLTARAVLRRPDHPPVELAAEHRMELPGDPLESFQLGVRLDGTRVATIVNGQPLVSWDLPSLTHGNLALRVSEGALRLQRVNASGRQTNQYGGWRAFTIAENLTEGPSPGHWPIYRETLLLAAAAAVGAALLLRSLCLARPRARDLASATLVWLAGPALALAMQAVRPVPSIEWVCAALALLALPLALSLLGPALRGPPDGSVARARLSLGVALLIAAATAVLYARHSMEALGPVVERVQAAQQTPLAPDWTCDVATLDAGNALEVPDVRRDLAVSATVRFAPDSALAVRLRAPDPQFARGVLFTLSGDERLASGFRLEEFRQFDALAETSGAQPTDRAQHLELRVQGDRYVALLDGREFLRAEDRTHAAGSVLFLAQRGAVRLTDVKVTSLAADGEVPSLLRAGLTGAILPLAVLLWALFAARPLCHSVRSLFCIGACALIPVAAGTLLTPRTSFTADTLLLAGAGAAGVLAVHALVHGPRARRPVLTTLALLLLAGGVWAVALPLALDDHALVDSTNLNRITCADWSGDRLEADLLYLQHPLLRRWDDWLARHRFHERTASLRRRPGVARILTLGGSSTYGYRIPPESRADWPAQLERQLQERGAPEVLNAAFVGATSNRLLHLFRSALLPFAPDIVVLNVTFNDSSSQAQGDEEAYFASVTDPARERSWYSDWTVRQERERECRALIRVIETVRHDSRPTIELWREAGMTSSPPARFERVLRQFAELCRENGIRLVLVKEPMAGDQRLVWKEEFREVMDRIGVEYALPVVDPTPALQAAGGRELFMDRVHLKPSGCAVVAAEVARAIEPLLASQ